MDFLIEKASVLLVWLEKLFQGNLSNLGKLLGFVGNFFGFLSLFFNKIANPTSVSSFLIIRSIVNAQISYFILRATKGGIKSGTTFLKTIFLRTFFGLLAGFCIVLTVRFLDMNHFYSLFNTQPIFTFWLGFFVLNESYAHDRFVCTVLVVIGVILVVNPKYLFFDFSDKEEKYENFQIGVFLALLGAFLKGIVLIYVKKMSSESPYKIMLYFETLRVIIPSVILIMSNTEISFPSFESIVFTILSGLTEYFYQIMCILSMRYERASVIGIIETSSIFYGFFFDVFFFKKSIEIGSLCGTFLIVSSSIYLMSLK